MHNPLTSEERAQILEVLEMLAAHCDDKDQDADPDDIPCIRCGKDALDTGWECTECGFDCRPYYYPQAMLRKATAQLTRTADDARDGIGLIAIERRRQVEAEGWTPEHDAEHYNGELASAAACYAEVEHKRRFYSDPRMKGAPIAWPWDWVEWKPTPENRIRELVKAGALIAAEIDRLQRAALASSKSEAAEGGGDV